MDAVRRVALVGAKGGCGTTLLTANLAAALAHSESVCAIDLDSGKGDLAGMLDITPTATLPELLASECDAAMLRGSATRHRAGFAVLAQPQDLSLLVRPSPAEVERLLDVACEAWSKVLVDCGSRVDEAILVALRRADRVVVVATPDILALRDAVRLHALLERVGVPAERHWLVLDRVPRRPPVPVADVEEILHIRVAATLVRDDEVCERATSEGLLVQEAAPGSALARDFENLWSRVSGEMPEARRWRLPWVGGAA